MVYFLGMDGGGTSTYAVVTDQYGKVHGVGKAGNGNYQINRHTAEVNIYAAANEAMQQADIRAAEIEFAWFGLAGGDRTIDFERLKEMIEPLAIKDFEVSGDTVIALRAGTMQPDGIVIICGSGVNAVGKNNRGESYQCGGFGYMYGDFGGGGDLSVEVFRAVVREWDGRGEPTALTPLLMEKLQYDTVEAMYHDYLDHGGMVSRDVTRILFPAAAKGDRVAKQILTYQGDELGRATKSVINKLNMQADVFDIVLAGSIVTRSGNDIIRHIIEEYAHALAPHSRIVPLTVEPVVGAILLAMEESGRGVVNETYEKLCKITNIGGN